MQEDPRNKSHLTHEDILQLNFIKKNPGYVFRRHHRSGLRSHIFQVLDPREVQRETTGLLTDGLRTFPKAKPIKMLRIFRLRFTNLAEAEEELKRVKVIDTFLAPHHLARSNEFLVEFIGGRKGEPLLCGLQDYIEGEIIDPWSNLDAHHLASLLERMSPSRGMMPDSAVKQWVLLVREKARDMIHNLKELIAKAHYVPDLAGSGNLLLTLSGHIKLVDINNISKVLFESHIPVDDREYPVCDKSIEALSLLEEKLLGKPVDRKERIYRLFLDPGRMREVQSIEFRFYHTLEPTA